MRRVDLYASGPHYLEHLAPIWQALPAEVRGAEYSPRAPLPAAVRSLDRGAPVLVASLADYMAVAPRPVVYVEHGAGQAYDGDPRSAGHGSYCGGTGLERVRLFLCPSERVAARWRDRYPLTPAVVVGSPRLDQLRASSAVESPHRPRVAFTFHWSCRLVPETKPALPHYHGALARVVAELRTSGVELDGHGHPRAWHDLAPVWDRLRIRRVRDFAQVVADDAVLVGDNTSALYEWAALGRPVVVLNAPWYRRDVDHGLRFWSHVPGRQVDHPEDLVPAIVEALDHPDRYGHLRSAATAEVYAHTDGHAAARAVAAILEEFTDG